MAQRQALLEYLESHKEDIVFLVHVAMARLRSDLSADIRWQSDRSSFENCAPVGVVLELLHTDGLTDIEVSELKESLVALLWDLTRNDTTDESSVQGAFLEHVLRPLRGETRRGKEKADQQVTRIRRVAFVLLGADALPLVSPVTAVVAPASWALAGVMLGVLGKDVR